MAARNSAPSRSTPIKQLLPDYVHPLGVRFSVTVLPIIEGDVETEVVMGDTNVDLKRIRVVDSQDSGRRWSTLYHEYLHASFGLVGIDDALESVSDSFEEMIVRAVETTTEQFLLVHGDKWLEALRAQRDE